MGKNSRPEERGPREKKRLPKEPFPCKLKSLLGSRSSGSSFGGRGSRGSSGRGRSGARGSFRGRGGSRSGFRGRGRSRGRSSFRSRGGGGSRSFHASGGGAFGLVLLLQYDVTSDAEDGDHGDDQGSLAHNTVFLLLS